MTIYAQVIMPSSKENFKLKTKLCIYVNLTNLKTFIMEYPRQQKIVIESFKLILHALFAIISN